MYILAYKTHSYVYPCIAFNKFGEFHAPPFIYCLYIYVCIHIHTYAYVYVFTHYAIKGCRALWIQYVYLKIYFIYNQYVHMILEGLVLGGPGLGHAS